MVERLETPVEAIHLNERSREMRAFTEGKNPLRVSGGGRPPQDTEGLEACGGDVTVR